MNDSPGGTARRLGIKRKDTLQLQEYLRRYRGGEFPSAQSIAENLEWPRESGLFVISSEAVAKTTVPKYQAKLGLEKLADGFHSVFCDLGNGIRSAGNLGAVEVADTLVFMGNVHSADSVADFRRDDPTERGRRPQEHDGGIRQHRHAGEGEARDHRRPGRPVEHAEAIRRALRNT